jgi:hypothetical protein
MAFGRLYGHSAFFLGKGDYWQAKRLDGELWFGSSKCITASGTPPSWLTVNLKDSTTHVVIVEGLVGVLEAVEAILRCGAGIGTVAVAGAYNRTSSLSGEQARYLSQRRTLIVADNDSGGLEAAARWQKTILLFGGEVERVVPLNGKDLGDVLKRSPDPLDAFLRFLPLQTAGSP